MGDFDAYRAPNGTRLGVSLTACLLLSVNLLGGRANVSTVVVYAFEVEAAKRPERAQARVLDGIGRPAVLAEKGGPG